MRSILRLMRKVSIFILIVASLMMSSCGEYQKVLKSKDPEYKYQMALEYFNNKKYVRSQTLFEDIASYYKGTERSEDVLAYIARSYMGQKNYDIASTYYEAYIRNYPKGRYIVEARFQLGHCKYLDSPDARLDQTTTNEAIQAFTEFIELYPDNQYIDQVYQELGELYDKLAYKEYLNAKLYYNLGTYLGNNYESCEVVARNALKNYPSNKYQEELNWLILQAKWQQTVNSVEERRMDRARDTEDECYSFISQYPDSKHRSAAEKIDKEMKKITKDK